MGIEDRPTHVERYTSPYPSRSGRGTLPYFVPFETIQGALFNYYEPSIGLESKRGGMSATVYLTHVDNYSEQGALNIVIIEDNYRTDKRTRTEWYFGTFRGKPRGETNGYETEIFDSNMEHVYSRHHRVPGSELDALIRNAAKLDDPHPLSWD